MVDVGGGTSTLADHLVDEGYDVTVLDVAPSALDTVRARVGDRATYVAADLLSWRPAETYDVWHDRAVFHFLTDRDDQRGYVDLAASAVRPGGALVMGTFATDGPTQCSGLPTTRWNAEQLMTLFGGAFELADQEREEHQTPGGAVQSFLRMTMRRL